MPPTVPVPRVAARAAGVVNSTYFACAALLCVWAASPLGAADANPRPFVHQVTGLFSPDRVEDLRLAVAEIPQLKLRSVDFERSEATFEYDPQQLFNTTKPHQVIERLDALVRSKSRSTLGVRHASATPPEMLVKVEIPVVGLDCKGCSWAAYQIVARNEGVDRVQVSFKEGRITAWIDPSETTREFLEEMLKRRGVTLAAPDRGQ